MGITQNKLKLAKFKPTKCKLAKSNKNNKHNNIINEGTYVSNKQAC